MKLRYFGTAVVALVVSACAFDANEPAQDGKFSENSAPASVSEPVRASDDANMDQLRQQAVAANRTQLVLAANANIVAEVPSGAAGKVYFVENDAGIAMFEAQRVGVPSALANLPANATALQAFEFLQPNGAVPEALSKAQARVDQLVQDRAGQPKTVAPNIEAVVAAEPVNDLPAAVATRGEVAGTRQALIDDSLCPGTWFQTTLCDYWRTGQGTCSMWKTNTGTYTNNDKNWVYTNSCPYRGTITHRLRQNTWGSWNLVALYTVAAGYYSTIWYSNNTFDFDYESKVYDADGDGWHHSAQWR